MTNTYKTENYHTLTPYLVCKGAAEAIDFYKRAFDARELYRLEYPKGGVGHAEIMIGDSPLMLADEHPEMGFLSPLSTGNSPVGMHLYVPDADALFARAIAAGAKEIKPVTEQFYGDRAGQVEDPFGYRWHVATAAKQTSPEEMLKLWDKMMEENE